MSSANPLWGAPRIVGELSKIGIDVAKSTVEKYMVRTRRPPSPTWKAFLKNHIESIVAIDFFVVPTVRNQIRVEEFVLEPVGPDLESLGVAGGTEDADFAAEGDEELGVAAFATDTRKARFEHSTVEKLLHRALGCPAQLRSCSASSSALSSAPCSLGSAGAAGRSASARVRRAR